MEEQNVILVLTHNGTIHFVMASVNMKNIQIATKEQMIAIQLAMTDMQQNMNSFIEHTSQINQSIIQRLFKSLLTKTLGGVKHIALVPEISKHKREPTN